LFWIIFLKYPSGIIGQCCNTKIVSGVRYNLVSSSDPAPSFCLGGCIYTKENDNKPGTNYCFKEGDDFVSCRGGECSSVEGWIKQYFQEECSGKINTYLGVNVEEQPIAHDNQCGPPPMILEADVLLFDNPRCEGKFYQNTTSRPSEEGFYSTADFFLMSEDPRPWSVLVTKEGYKTVCQPVGVIKPFANNIKSARILREENNNIGITPITFIDFSFVITNQLLPDVFVQGNPRQTCQRSYHGPPPPENPHPELGKCFPTCTYSSWDTDPGKRGCLCRGMIGRGLKFDSTSIPNQIDLNGKGKIMGGLLAYGVTQYPNIFLLYVDFQRRGSDSIKVCESKLEITQDSPLFQVKYKKQVPCFEAKKTPVENKPSSELPTATDLEAMFSEVDGVLVWGGSDRFWIVACDLIDIDFFTAKHPAETPEFCGCISQFVQGPFGTVTKEQMKQCYVEALLDGPTPQFSSNGGMNRFTMWHFNENKI